MGGSLLPAHRSAAFPAVRYTPVLRTGCRFHRAAHQQYINTQQPVLRAKCL